MSVIKTLAPASVGVGVIPPIVAGSNVIPAVVAPDAFVSADETATDSVARAMAAAPSQVPGGVYRAPLKSRLETEDEARLREVISSGTFEDIIAEIERLTLTVEEAERPFNLDSMATELVHYSIFTDQYELVSLKVLHHISEKMAAFKDVTSFDPAKDREYANCYRTTLNWLYHFELNHARSWAEYTSEMQEMVADIHFAAARTMGLQSLVEDPDSVLHQAEIFSEALDAKCRYKKLGLFGKARNAESFMCDIEERFGIKREDAFQGFIALAENKVEQAMKVVPAVNFFMAGLESLRNAGGRFLSVEIFDRLAVIFERYKVDAEQIAELRKWSADIKEMDRDMGLIPATREEIAETKVKRIVKESGYGRELSSERVERSVGTVEKFRDYLVMAAAIMQETMKEFKHQDLTEHANFFMTLTDIAHEIEALYAGTKDAKKVLALVADMLHVDARYGQLYYAGDRECWTEKEMRFKVPVVVLELSDAINRYKFVGEEEKSRDIQAFLERMRRRFDLPEGDLKEWALARAKERIDGNIKFLQDDGATGNFLKQMLNALLVGYMSGARSYGYKTEAEFLRWLAVRLHELGQDEIAAEKELLKTAAEAERIGKLLGLI